MQETNRWFAAGLCIDSNAQRLGDGTAAVGLEMLSELMHLVQHQYVTPRPIAYGPFLY